MHKKKVMVGIVTFGNLEFTKLAVRSVFETYTLKELAVLDICIVCGKPEDLATVEWCSENGIAYIKHNTNLGFAASINDLYDRAWQDGVSDYLIMMGNDVVAYPGAIDGMVKEAMDSDWEWIGASQFDARSLVERYAEARPFFKGSNLVFEDFSSRVWEMHRDFRPYGVDKNVIRDVRNLCLFKRSVFEKIGYADVNFWPGGYFEDNDYCRRGNLMGLKACNLHHAAYFHFWSRTIHQGNGSTTGRHFERNSGYYQKKWGGAVDHETFAMPFNKPGELVGIFGRYDERGNIQYWQTMGI